MKHSCINCKYADWTVGDQQIGYCKLLHIAVFANDLCDGWANIKKTNQGD